MKIELNTTAKAMECILITIIVSQPIKQKVIASRYDITTRTVRKYVHQLREQGYLVKGTNKGYVIAEDPKEFDEEIAKLNRRRKSFTTMKRRYYQKTNKNLFEK